MNAQSSVRKKNSHIHWYDNEGGFSIKPDESTAARCYTSFSSYNNQLLSESKTPPPLISCEPVNAILLEVQFARRGDLKDDLAQHGLLEPIDYKCIAIRSKDLLQLQFSELITWAWFVRVNSDYENVTDKNFTRGWRISLCDPIEKFQHHDAIFKCFTTDRIRGMMREPDGKSWYSHFQHTMVNHDAVGELPKFLEMINHYKIHDMAQYHVDCWDMHKQGVRVKDLPDFPVLPNFKATTIETDAQWRDMVERDDYILQQKETERKQDEKGIGEMEGAQPAIKNCGLTKSMYDPNFVSRRMNQTVEEVINEKDGEIADMMEAIMKAATSIKENMTADEAARIQEEMQNEVRRLESVREITTDVVRHRMKASPLTNGREHAPTPSDFMKRSAETFANLPPDIKNRLELKRRRSLNQINQIRLQRQQKPISYDDFINRRASAGLIDSGEMTQKLKQARKEERLAIRRFRLTKGEDVSDDEQDTDDEAQPAPAPTPVKRHDGQPMDEEDKANYRKDRAELDQLRVYQQEPTPMHESPRAATGTSAGFTTTAPSTSYYPLAMREKGQRVNCSKPIISSTHLNQEPHDDGSSQQAADISLIKPKNNTGDAKPNTTGKELSKDAMSLSPPSNNQGDGTQRPLKRKRLNDSNERSSSSNPNTSSHQIRQKKRILQQLSEEQKQAKEEEKIKTQREREDEIRLELEQDFQKQREQLESMLKEARDEQAKKDEEERLRLEKEEERRLDDEMRETINEADALNRQRLEAKQRSKTENILVGASASIKSRKYPSVPPPTDMKSRPIIAPKPTPTLSVADDETLSQHQAAMAEATSFTLPIVAPINTQQNEALFNNQSSSMTEQFKPEWTSSVKRIAPYSKSRKAKQPPRQPTRYSSRVKQQQQRKEGGKSEHNVTLGSLGSHNNDSRANYDNSSVIEDPNMKTLFGTTTSGTRSESDVIDLTNINASSDTNTSNSDGRNDSDQDVMRNVSNLRNMWESRIQTSNSDDMEQIHDLSNYPGTYKGVHNGRRLYDYASIQEEPNRHEQNIDAMQNTTLAPVANGDFDSYDTFDDDFEEETEMRHRWNDNHRQNVAKIVNQTDFCLSESTNTSRSLNSPRAHMQGDMKSVKTRSRSGSLTEQVKWLNRKYSYTRHAWRRHKPKSRIREGRYQSSQLPVVVRNYNKILKIFTCHCHNVVVVALTELGSKLTVTTDQQCLRTAKCHHVTVNEILDFLDEFQYDWEETRRAILNRMFIDKQVMMNVVNETDAGFCMKIDEDSVEYYDIQENQKFNNMLGCHIGAFDYPKETRKWKRKMRELAVMIDYAESCGVSDLRKMVQTQISPFDTAKSAQSTIATKELGETDIGDWAMSIVDKSSVSLIEEQRNRPSDVSNINNIGFANANRLKNDNFWLEGDRVKQTPTMLPIKTGWKSKPELEDAIEITYANIPMQRVIGRKKESNILKDVTDYFPKTSIFGLTEMFLETTNGECLHKPPTGYTAVWRDEDSVKYTAVMYQSSLGTHKMVKSPQHITSTKIVNRMGRLLVQVTVIYRSQNLFGRNGDKSKFYQTIRQDRSRDINEEDAYIRRVIEFLHSTKSNQHIVLSDLNMCKENVNSTGRSDIEKKHKKNLLELFTEKFNDIIEHEKCTFISTTKTRTKLDWLMSTDDMITQLIQLYYPGEHPLSDHMICTFRIQNVRIGAKTQLPSLRSDKFIWNGEKGPMSTRLVIKDPQVAEQIELANPQASITEKNWRMAEQLCMLKVKWKNDDKAKQALGFMRQLSDCAKLANPDTLRPPRQVKNAFKSTQESRELHQKAMQQANLVKSLKKRDRNGTLSREVYKLNLLDSEYKQLRRRLIREQTRVSIELKALKGKVDPWRIYKAYMGRPNPLAVQITPDQLAQCFNEMCWDYKAKNMIEGPAWNTLHQYDPEKFSFRLPITPDHEEPIQNLKYLLWDGKGSMDSSGTDKIKLAQILSMHTQYHAEFARIITLIMETGRYPKSFRRFICRPVPKKAVVTEPKMMRPVHVSNSPCGVVEKVMLKHMVRFWELNNLLHHQQYGFRAGHDIEGLINIMRKYFYSTDKDQLGQERVWLCILTDMSNAFGAVDHQIILNKLCPFMNYGAMRLVQSFLNQGTVQVQMGDKMSGEYTTALRGYSQGANISPFMYNTLMCESHTDDVGTLASFADDASALKVGKTIEDTSEDGLVMLKRFHEYCISNNIKMNNSKTKVLATKVKWSKLGSPTFEPVTMNLRYDGAELEQEEETRVLGMILNDKFKMEPHFKHLQVNLKSRVGSIKAMSPITGRKAVRALIMGLVYGKFQFGISTMQLGDTASYQKLQTLVNRALQIHWMDEVERLMETGCGYNKAVRVKVLKLIENFKRGERYLTIHQPVLLRTAGLLSMYNVHKKALLNRPNRVLVSGLPKREFEEFMDIFAYPDLINGEGRSLTPMMHDTLKRMKYQSVLFRQTSPFNMRQLFYDLPDELRSLYGTVKFKEALKKFLTDVCQHQVNIQRQCRVCKKHTTESVLMPLSKLIPRMKLDYTMPKASAISPIRLADKIENGQLKAKEIAQLPKFVLFKVMNILRKRGHTPGAKLTRDLM